MFYRRLPNIDDLTNGNGDAHKQETISLLARSLLDIAISDFRMVAVFAADAMTDSETADRSHSKLKSWVDASGSPEQVIMRLRVVVTALITVGADKRYPTRFHNVCADILSYVAGRHERLPERHGKDFSELALADQDMPNF